MIARNRLCHHRRVVPRPTVSRHCKKGSGRTRRIAKQDFCGPSPHNCRAPEEVPCLMSSNMTRCYSVAETAGAASGCMTHSVLPE